MSAATERPAHGGYPGKPGVGVKRPWKVVHHEIGQRGRLVERVDSYATLERAFEPFKVAVLFDMNARLEYRGDGWAGL